MSALDEIIRTEIKRDGSIPFARLMELALYCPQFGFYDRIENRIGREGDFYTSVSVGSLFGELLARRFLSWMDPIRDGEFQLLEAGAHDGRLALDILGWITTHRPELDGRLHYWILEPLQSRRRLQRRTLERFLERVRWFECWEALPRTGIRGVIFSNELFDAMPVHRLGWNARLREWFEWGVEIQNRDLTWTRLPTDSRLTDFPLMARLPEELLEVLPNDFTTEVCPAAVEWWDRAARTLQQGKLMTIDYGLEAEQFFVPERSTGTLCAYYRHHANSELLARIGDQDLTAQVNFTALRTTGEAAGLRTEGVYSQRAFLTGIFESMMKSGSNLDNDARTQEFHTLTHPDHLGRAFRVLIQSR